MKYDFGGWATKYNIKCADGRTISHAAFVDQDGAKVPLVWNHNHQGPDGVIGHAVLKHADVGVYAYCSFNETETAKTAKDLVVHGDITALSIFANKLKSEGGSVKHGTIRELSLVLAGANPGASIQEVLAHSDDDTVSAVIYCDEDDIELSHSDTEDEGEEEVIEHADDSEETIADIYNTMNEKQKNVVAIIADQLLNQEVEEDESMKHNVFENKNEGAEIKHSQILAEAMADVKKHNGSLKESLEHSATAYGIEDIGELFPVEKNVQNEPMFIDRDQTWVGPFLNGVKKSPFSRLRAVYADITGDDARALGYVKGNLKKEEVFGLLTRTTSPTTIYKKQKLDRDDIIDITDFNVVNWLKGEMRGKLNEEIARAMLIGDGRSASSPDKIKEANIRPIVSDSDLYTIKYAMPANSSNVAKDFIKACLKARVDYEGANPTLYTTEEFLADMLLIEDANGRFIYDSEATLCKTLRVKQIVCVPVLKGFQRPTTDSKYHYVNGILVNPADYTLGADKGGQVSMFDDFDIDYNQYKYLMETRCSGSLLKPKTAIVIEQVETTARA